MILRVFHAVEVVAEMEARDGLTQECEENN